MFSSKRYVGLAFKISLLFVMFAWTISVFDFMLTYGQSLSRLSQNFHREVRTKTLWIRDVLKESTLLRGKDQQEQKLSTLLKRLRLRTGALNIYLIVLQKDSRTIISALPFPFPVAESKVEAALKRASRGEVVIVRERQAKGKWGIAPVLHTGKQQMIVALLIGSDRSAEKLETMKKQHILFLLFSIVISLLSGLILAVALSRPIRLLLSGLKRVEAGDLKHKIQETHLLGVPIDDELSEMAKVFNKMTENLFQKSVENQALYEEINAFNRELANKVKEATSELSAANNKLLAQKEATDLDLKLARSIQTALLPKSLKIDALSVEGRCFPAMDIGGDFYAFLPLDEEHVTLLIGDVAGRGISASLLMSFVYGVFLEATHRHLSPKQTLELVNQSLCQYIPTEGHQFVTCFLGCYHLPTRTLTYVNAGHYSPFLIRSQKVSVIPSAGTLLGVFPEIKWQEEKIVLQSRDYLVLVTDGIMEAQNAAGERLFEEGFIKLCEQNLDHSFPEVIDKIMESVLKWSANKPNDDMALMLVQINENLRQARRRK